MKQLRLIALLPFVLFFVPRFCIGQIEDEIRQTITYKRNPVSEVRKRIALAIFSGNISFARTLTDSLRSATHNFPDKPFKLSELFVLERLMGRSDSAVKAFYDPNFQTEESAQATYSFVEHDFIFINFYKLYLKQESDSSYLADSSLTMETKDFIRFYNRTNSHSSNLLRLAKRSYANIIREERERNVNARLFLQKYPRTLFKEYMKVFMDNRCFAQMNGINLHWELAYWKPMGSVRFKLDPGFLYHFGLQLTRPRYKLGMGLKICLSTVNKMIIHELDSVAHNKPYATVSYLLQNEFLVKDGPKVRHWVQLNSEIGNCRLDAEKNNKSIRFNAGPMVDFSIGYHFQYLNINSTEMNTVSPTFLNYGILVKAGYFSTLSNWKIQGTYVTVGLTFGILFATGTNVPDANQIKKYRW
ncbi:MAG TPA: hypothetical protein PK509_13310 [Catalimonadaceae bacterium]|nr:hypothetical protein [Catalimonadaceae bacterium]